MSDRDTRSVSEEQISELRSAVGNRRFDDIKGYLLKRFDRLVAERDSLKADVERLKADGERLDWLFMERYPLEILDAFFLPEDESLDEASRWRATLDRVIASQRTISDLSAATK